MVRYEDSMLRNITKKYIHIHFNAGSGWPSNRSRCSWNKLRTTPICPTPPPHELHIEISTRLPTCWLCHSSTRRGTAGSTSTFTMTAVGPRPIAINRLLLRIFMRPISRRLQTGPGSWTPCRQLLSITKLKFHCLALWPQFYIIYSSSI